MRPGIILLSLLVLTAFAGLPVRADTTETLAQASRSYDRHDYAECVKLIEPLVSAGASQSDVFRLLGHSYFMLGRLSEARKALLRCIGLGGISEDVIARIVQIDQRQGTPFGALAGLSLLLLFEPGETQVILSYADVIDGLGLHDEALAILERMLSEDRSPVEVLQRIGNIHSAKGELRQAAVAFETAYYLGDRHPGLVIAIAELHIAQADYPGALLWYDRADEGTLNDKGRLRIGELLVRAKELARARELLTRLTGSTEDGVAIGAYSLLGQVELACGNTEATVSCWERCASGKNADPAILVFLGEHFMSSGDFRRAADFLQRAVEARGPQRELLRACFACLVKCLDFAGARSCLVNYTETYGLDDSARKMVSVLADAMSEK